MTILLNKPLKPSLKKLTSYLAEVNDRGWYTNFGPLHQKLTAKLEEYLEVENLLLVSNGTIALHIAYRALGISNAISTPFSYVATSSSLAWEQIPFTFADIDNRSLNLCPKKVADKLDINTNIDSIIATHVYGNPCDLEYFEKLKNKYKIKLIYDGAHAFNVRYGSESVLKYGDATTLSFHATKLFHTIEGGAIVFKDQKKLKRAREIINFSQDTDGKINGVGINAKLNEYQCAVGLTLLEVMSEVIEHRVDLFNLYWKNLKDCVQLPRWNQSASLNGAYFPIILKNEESRNRIKMALLNAEIPSREYFAPSLNTIFKPEESCPVSESISSRVLCLPLHFSLTKKDLAYICEILKNNLL